MKHRRVIPVLLLHNGSLVKSIKFSNYKYVGDPINAVRILNEKEVDELVLLDISASAQGREPNYRHLEQIASEAFMPVAYGGGVKSVDTIKKIIKLGIEKIILNTIAFENPLLIQQAANVVGNQSIVVSFDCKKDIWGKYHVVYNNGKKKSHWDPIRFAKEMEKYGAGDLFINSVDKDGTYKGYELSLIKLISQEIKIPIIICGGASDYNDFRLALQNGASAVSAGSMFVFQRPHQAVLISYPTQEELHNHIFSKI